MAAAALAPIFAALVPITVLQLVLIHIDHEVPPRCVNLLDINISAHAPRMRIALRAGQRAAICADADPLAGSPPAAWRSASLTARPPAEYGECDELLRSGRFTCEHDFCPTCDAGHEGYQFHQVRRDSPQPSQPSAARLLGERALRAR